MIGLGTTPRRRKLEVNARSALTGIDLGAYSLKAVRFSTSKEGLRLECARLIPYERPLSNTDPEGSLDRISAALAESRLGGTRWNPLPVALTLPLCMTQMRLVDAPAGEELDEEEQILRELGAEDSQHQEEWIGDYWPTQGSAPSEGNTTLGLVGARRGWVEELVRCFEEHRMEPRLVDGAPFAIARALKRGGNEKEEIQAALDIGCEGAFFTLFKRGTPIYFRTLRGCGMRNIAEAIQHGLNIEEREAYQFLKACCQAARRPSAASKTMLNSLTEMAAMPLRRLQNELARTLDFSRRQSEASSLKRITLLGGGALLPGITSLLESWADLDFRIWSTRLDPLSEVQADTIPLYAQAIALAELSRDE